MLNRKQTPYQWKHNLWPWFALFVLIVVVAVNIWVFMIAQKSAPIITDESYYQLGIDYQKEIDRKIASQKLAWDARLTWEQQGLRLMMRSATQKPVSGLHGYITLYRSDRTDYDQKLGFEEINNGVYQAKFLSSIQGAVNYSIHLTHGQNKSTWSKQGQSYLEH